MYRRYWKLLPAWGGVNYSRITMVNGEEIPIGMKEYNALLDLIQDEWEGIRVLPHVLDL